MFFLYSCLCMYMWLTTFISQTTLFLSKFTVHSNTQIQKLTKHSFVSNAFFVKDNTPPRTCLATLITKKHLREGVCRSSVTTELTIIFFVCVCEKKNWKESKHCEPISNYGSTGGFIESQTNLFPLNDTLRHFVRSRFIKTLFWAASSLSFLHFWQ